MARRKRYLTATMPDGYVKTIGPTADPFTHYWRIVAELENGKTEDPQLDGCRPPGRSISPKLRADQSALRRWRISLPALK